MDEIETEEQISGALPVDAPLTREAFLQQYTGQMGTLREAQAREAAARQQLFEQAEQRLQQRNPMRFGSPEITQALFGLAGALSSPRPYGGFAGTMANVAPALAQGFGGISQAQRDRDAQLQQLREQYQLGSAQAETAGAQAQLESLADLAAFYTKPQPRTRSAISPLTGEVIDLDTGQIIKPELPAGTTRVYQGIEYEFLGGDQYDQNNWRPAS